jgi:archaellum biogenesis protein FlaJ (TadC family)
MKAVRIIRPKESLGGYKYLMSWVQELIQKWQNYQSALSFGVSIKTESKYVNVSDICI